MTTKITPAQKALLTNAAYWGNPWRTEKGSLPYRTSTSRCIDNLVGKGLLEHTAGKGHVAPKITAAGCKALGI